MTVKQVTVLTTLLLSMGVSTEAQIPPSPASNSPVAYTLVLKGERHDARGVVTPMFTETLYRAGDGRFHSIKQFSETRSVETFGIPSTGILVADKVSHKLLLKGPYSLVSPGDRPANAGQTATSSGATILGHNIEVVHLVRGERTIDLYKAPDLAGAVLKSVISYKGATYVTEAESIALGEPPASTLTLPQNSIDSSQALPVMPK